MEELTRGLIGPQGAPGRSGRSGRQGPPGIQGIPGTFDTPAKKNLCTYCVSNTYQSLSLVLIPYK